MGLQLELPDDVLSEINEKLNQGDNVVEPTTPNRNTNSPSGHGTPSLTPAKEVLLPPRIHGARPVDFGQPPAMNGTLRPPGKKRCHDQAFAGSAEDLTVQERPAKRLAVERDALNTDWSAEMSEEEAHQLGGETIRDVCQLLIDFDNLGLLLTILDYD